mmetsp:Transcript_31754/g.100921  ORF Transcript_31754/g.100921 Transcript_31754/m.100921 type:complete len:576 (-) Transcript_31754:233-1960(-)
MLGRASNFVPSRSSANAIRPSSQLQLAGTRNSTNRSATRAAPGKGPAEACWYCHLCSQKNDSVFDKCKTCGRPSQYTAPGPKPLHGQASDFLRQEHVDTVLQDAEDVHAIDSRNWNALHCAVIYENAGIVESLLERGAFIEGQTKFGWRALHLACYSGTLEMVDALLRHSPKLDPQTKAHGDTPLIVAATRGFPLIAERLLRAGADKDLANAIGRTALHCVAQNGNVELCEILLEHGANMTIADFDCWTPRMTAEFYGHWPIVKRLVLAERNRDGDFQQHTLRALPPADWHGELWNQVVGGCERSRDFVEADRNVRSMLYTHVLKKPNPRLTAPGRSTLESRGDPSQLVPLSPNYSRRGDKRSQPERSHVAAFVGNNFDVTSRGSPGARSAKSRGLSRGSRATTAGLGTPMSRGFRTPGGLRMPTPGVPMSPLTPGSRGRSSLRRMGSRQLTRSIQVSREIKDRNELLQSREQSPPRTGSQMSIRSISERRKRRARGGSERTGASSPGEGSEKPARTVATGLPGAAGAPGGAQKGPASLVRERNRMKRSATPSKIQFKDWDNDEKNAFPFFETGE